jgi:hypothetical protein
MAENGGGGGGKGRGREKGPNSMVLYSTVRERRSYCYSHADMV